MGLLFRNNCCFLGTRLAKNCLFIKGQSAASSYNILMSYDLMLFLMPEEITSKSQNAHWSIPSQNKVTLKVLLFYEMLGFEVEIFNFVFSGAFWPACASSGSTLADESSLRKLWRHPIVVFVWWRAFKGSKCASFDDRVSTNIKAAF